MKTIAIIPAYNEESTIGDLIKATSRFVDEILVINDGSTDDIADFVVQMMLMDNTIQRR
jgi:glycosyltransferase involved in cell wall biosynthesis